MPTFAEQNELSGPQQILQQPVFGKEIRCIFNRKNIVTVYTEIKVTVTQGDFFIFCFLSEKIDQNLKKITDPPVHYSTSSSVSAYGTSGSYLDKKLTRALVQHQKVTDVTYIVWLKELKRA